MGSVMYLFFNGKLGGSYDEVHASFNTDCKVMREEVSREAMSVHPRDMIGDDAAEGRRYADGAQLGRVFGVLV